MNASIRFGVRLIKDAAMVGRKFGLSDLRTRARNRCRDERPVAPADCLRPCALAGRCLSVWLCTQPLHWRNGKHRYDPIAQMLTGHGFSTDKAPPYHRMGQVPLFPIFLARPAGLTGYSTAAVVVAQVLMELLIVLLTAQWMRRLDLPASQIWTVVGAWFLVPLFTINVRICYTETLVTLLFTLACYFLTCLYKASSRQRLWYSAAAGICIGLASLTRAEMPIANHLAACALDDLCHLLDRPRRPV